MKRILIFSLAYFPKHVGGAEVAIKEKTDRLTDYEFHLITLRYDSTLPKMEKIGNVLVHRIGFARANPSMGDLRKFPLRLNKYWYQFAAAVKAFSLHRRYRYDAVWAMMAHSAGVPAALFNLFRPEVPYLLELQEGDPPERIERLARSVWPLFSRAFMQATVVSVISNFLGDWARRRGFAGEVILVPNAVDGKHFSQEYARAALEEKRRALHREPGDVFLVTTSRLVHKNAVDDVIRALALLPENVHFVIYGVGPDEAMLKDLARKFSVESRVHFMGQIGHAEMPLALKACDIFIRPSRSEGMGNSFVEAMAAGLPVIATQEGGIADFLFDAKRNPGRDATGWAVDKDSPEQIAQAVTSILAHPEEVARVTASAKNMALERYDWDLIAAKMRAVFEKLCAARIVLATPLYSPEIGGPSTYARELVEGLPARGVEVALMKFSDVRYLPKLVRHYAYYRRVLRAARTADAVLALDPVSVGFPAMYAARRARKPFFVKIVGDYAWEQGRQRFGVTQTLDDFVKARQTSFRVRLLQAVQARVARSATRILVPSGYLKGIVHAWGSAYRKAGVSEEKIVVVHNGIALPERLPEVKRPEGFFVVSSGRRVPWKGFEGIERVVTRETGWHFSLVSGLPREEALARVKSADAFVLNSTYEGLSHALIEAMMLGTPVVATRAGGNAELVEHGVTGLLVPAGDDEALLSALKSIAADPDAARARAERARERMKQFSVDVMLDATATLVTSRKKFLFISNDLSIFDPASATRARMRAYAAALGELHILSAAPAAARKEQDGPLHLHPVHAGRLLRVRALARAGRALIRKYGIDVVSAQDPFEQGLAALRAVSGTGAKLHIQVHTDFLSPWFVSGGVRAALLNRLRRRIAGRVVPHAAGIRTVSKRVQASLRARYGTRIPEPVVIPVAVSVAEEPPATLPKHFPFSFIAVGRLEPEKRIEDILAAFALAKAKHPGIGLFIVGEGRERATLKHQAHALGIADEVVFLGARPNVRALMASADAFVQASAYEGYGRTLLEAALANVPIVTTDVGIVGEVFQDGRDALVAPVDAPEALSQSLAALIEDRALRERLSAHARKSAHEHLVAVGDPTARVVENLAHMTNRP